MLIYYLLALSMGFMVILNPILNGKLAERVGTLHASFINYATAVAAATVATLAFQPAGISMDALRHTPPHYYLGGVLGVFVILLLNYIVPRLPAVLIVVIPFAGQMAMSTLIDYAALGQFSLNKVIGAFFLLAGLLINAALDQRWTRRKNLHNDSGRSSQTAA